MDRDIMEGFQHESLDMLDEIEPILINISNESVIITIDVINDIFRTFHTIKGCAGSLGLETLTKLGHEAESLLDFFREEDNYKLIQSYHIDKLCETIDLLRIIIEEIDLESLKESDIDISNICLELNDITKNVKDKKLSNGVENDSLHDQFMSDGIEIISELEESILSLKESSGNKELIQHVYRTIHNFKGNCSLIGYDDLEKISHCIESILLPIRSGEIDFNDDICSICINTIDCIKKSLKDANNEVPKIESLDVLVDILTEYIPKDKVKDEVKDDVKDEVKDKVETVLFVDDNKFAREKIKNIYEKSNYKVFTSNCGSDALEKLKKENISLLVTDLNMPIMNGVELIKKVNDYMPNLPIIVMSGREDISMFKELIGTELSGYCDKNVDKNKLLSLSLKAIKDGIKKKLTSSSIKEDSNVVFKPRNDIRVDMSKLDQVLNLVGELLIAESLVTSHPDIKKIQSFSESAEQLKGIINELHDVTLGLRMVPVESLFKKMIRVVHDVSNKTNKKIKLVMEGEETELDKIVIDALSDPLIHMIRNSADHGIETPSDRLKNKKEEVGTILLKANQKGNEVSITIKDDGNGLSKDKILSKALEKNIIDDNKIKNMSDEEIYQLIFSPGFSTADKVTDVSGRGVGMDVVRKNIESVNGRIDIESDYGNGSSFTIRIPLNLATMEGILFRVGKQKYTIPISSIRETFRLENEELSKRADGLEYVTLRDEVIPIVRLHNIHEIEPDSKEIKDGILVVLDVSDGCFCLLVDEMLYQMDTVIKDFSGYIKSLPTICGSNILGDGKISLILNVENIIRMLKNGNINKFYDRV